MYTIVERKENKAEEAGGVIGMGTPKGKRGGGIDYLD